MQEYQAIQAFAKRQGVTMGEWVRRLIHDAMQDQSTATVTKKMAALQAAISHAEPVADIDQMLAEIEQGYLSGDGPV